MKKEHLIRISFLAVVLVWVGIGGYFFYSKAYRGKSGKKETSIRERDSDSRGPVDRPFKEYAFSSFSTLKFKTYENSEIGFQLHYPSNFVYSESKSANRPTVVYVSFVPKGESELPEFWLEVSENSYDQLKNVMSSTDQERNVLGMEEVTVAGVRGFKLFDNTKDGSSTQNQKVKYIFPSPQDNYTFILFANLKGAGEEGRKLIDHMLSSFEFI